MAICFLMYCTDNFALQVIRGNSVTSMETLESTRTFATTQ
jgi:hypothetical protein